MADLLFDGHGTGALYREPDARDWQLILLPEVQAALPELPGSFMVLPMAAVQVKYNQGARPSCVSESECGAKSIEDFQDTSIWNRYDATELYRACGGNGMNGIFTDAALRYAVGTGLLVAGSQRRFKLASYLFAPQVAGDFRRTLAAALVASGPCVVAMLLPSIFGWNSGESPTSGYHQMCLVGYEGLGDGDYAVFLNSWGEGWGNQGFCRIAWRYLEMNGNFQNRYVYAYRMVDFIDKGTIPVPTPPPGELTVELYLFRGGFQAVAKGRDGHYVTGTVSATVDKRPLTMLRPTTMALAGGLQAMPATAILRSGWRQLRVTIKAADGRTGGKGVDA